MKKQKRLLFPIVSLGAEYLTIGQLMRRNILSYKAPQNNEGYDLICIHPDPRHKAKPEEHQIIRVQVKSRYQSDSNMSIDVSKKTLDAFDYLIAVFMNIGEFFNGKDGSKGEKEIEYYTLPSSFVKDHHKITSNRGQIRLNKLQKEIKQYKNRAGFELIASDLGISKPKRLRKSAG